MAWRLRLFSPTTNRLVATATLQALLISSCVQAQQPRPIGQNPQPQPQPQPQQGPRPWPAQGSTNPPEPAHPPQPDITAISNGARQVAAQITTAAQALIYGATSGNFGSQVIPSAFASRWSSLPLPSVSSKHLWLLAAFFPAKYTIKTKLKINLDFDVYIP